MYGACGKNHARKRPFVLEYERLTDVDARVSMGINRLGNTLAIPTGLVVYPLLVNLASDQSLIELYDVEGGLTVALQGRPHKEIARAMGLSERQYYRYRFNDALFREAVDRARAEGLECIQDSVLTIVEDNIDRMPPQAIKTKLDGIMWFLKVADPIKYGDRLIVREEKVDLAGALQSAKTRVLDITPKPPIIDPFEE